VSNVADGAGVKLEHDEGVDDKSFIGAAASVSGESSASAHTAYAALDAQIHDLAQVEAERLQSYAMAQEAEEKASQQLLNAHKAVQAAESHVVEMRKARKAAVRALATAKREKDKVVLMKRERLGLEKRMKEIDEAALAHRREQ
jgi:outer membrane receptor for monomeric catechols